MRICLVYDCLFPYTVGGAERWYRNLADELVRDGHEVTYLTRRQWPEAEPPQIDGVRVVAVSRDEPLYTEDGRRSVGPPLRFGLGVLRHLAANRRRYDVVHGCSFPYFSLLATRAALAGRRVTIGVDWFEVWSRDYWREYLGPVGGRVGDAVQRLCARVTPLAFAFSDLHARRLREQGLRSEPVRLSGLYAGPLEAHAGEGAATPLVLFAGRHIREKRAHLVPAVVAAARRELPELRGLVLGDGPERERVLAEIDGHGLRDAVEAPGFVGAGEVEAAFERATCMLLPSSREGYGMVVIEAAAAGTPSVVVAGPDNAAVELVEEGENGFVAASADPEEIARAVLRAHAGGAELRERTAAWFERNASRLTAAGSAREIAARYERGQR